MKSKMETQDAEEEYPAYTQGYISKKEVSAEIDDYIIRTYVVEKHEC